MPLPSKWASTKAAKPKKQPEWQTRAYLEPKKEEKQMQPSAEEPATAPAPERKYMDGPSQDQHMRYPDFPAQYYPLQQAPSPPRESPAPSLPPRTHAIPVVYEEETNRAQSAPLEFIPSPPPDGRDTRNRDRKLPPLSHASSVDRRRSDSHKNETFFRSSSPVSRTVSVSLSAADRPLPMRPGSNDARQEKQGEPGKKESASILDELMERYERKAVETRSAHERELWKIQRDHDKSVERLKHELAQTKQSHSMEVKSLKEERHAAEGKWQNMYNTMEAQREESNIARSELERLKTEFERLKAEHVVQLKRACDEREYHVAGLQKQLDIADMNTRSDIDGLERELDKLKAQYERKLQEQAEKHQQTVDQMQSRNEGQVAELKQKLADLEKYVEIQAHQIDRMTGHEGSQQKEVESLKKQCVELQAKAAAQNEAFVKQKEALAVEFKKQHDYYEGITAMHEKRQQKQQGTHDQERAGFEERLKQQTEVFAQEMKKNAAYYQRETDKLREHHRHELEMAVLEYKKRILSLESDLIDNGDDMRPSLGGGPLQARYRALKLKVETVTEPFNLGQIGLPHGFATDQLDQSDQNRFLAKEGKGQLRFLLRSICWSIIMDGFFSSPFGFGAFGPGEGKKMLFEVYAAWQKLFDPNFTALIASPEFSGQEDFEPFYNDKFANWWRSATFQSIQSVVLPSRRASQAGKPPAAEAADQRPQGIARIFADNVSRVKGTILDVIAKACGVDGVSEEIEAEVDEMVRCASQLGVEFGAHGAKICFGMPRRGDTVQIGTEFVDCQDGDSHRGQLETVELAVTPSLFMIGDGRKDLTTASCLYAGEIYPQRDTSS